MLKTILKTSTFRQSGITFSATIINGLLGALFYILSARILGPADFGILIVAIMILTLVVDVSNLGIDTGIVRFVSKYWQKNKEKALSFISLAIKVKFSVSLVVVILGLLSSSFIAEVIFGKRELTTPLRVSFLGVLGFQFYFFNISLLQALQKYWSWSVLQTSTNFLRIIALSLFLVLGKINLVIVLIIYISLPIFGSIIASLLLRGSMSIRENDERVVQEFYSYSKWVALSTLLSAVSSRLDTFISARLLSPLDLGYYAAANQLIVAVPQIIGALGTVFAPKMASMGNKENLMNYLKKTQLFISGLVGLGLLALPVIVYLIPFIYGEDYSKAVGQIFTILFLAMMIFLFATPVHNAIFYYYGNSKLLSTLSLLQLLIVGILGWILTSTYGTIGAALTVLTAMSVNFILSGMWILRKIRKINE